MADIQELEKTIKTLQREVEQLKQRRVGQADIIPDAVKMRHIGEGVRYIRSGTLADRPTVGEEPLQGSPIYFVKGSNLFLWDDTTDTWIEFIRAAGTTYTITNVTPDRAYDADATTTAELADTLGTLIADLRTVGLVE